MVTVTDYHVRESKDGKSFTTLTLLGEMEIIKSQSSGNYYATARKASIVTTFNEETCKRMVGTELAGCIEKAPVDEPYDYQIPDTDEVIQLDYTYRFNPDPASVEETVFS